MIHMGGDQATASDMTLAFDDQIVARNLGPDAVEPGREPNAPGARRPPEAGSSARAKSASMTSSGVMPIARQSARSTADGTTQSVPGRNTAAAATCTASNPVGTRVNFPTPTLVAARPRWDLPTEWGGDCSRSSTHSRRSIARAISIAWYDVSSVSD